MNDDESIYNRQSEIQELFDEAQQYSTQNGTAYDDVVDFSYVIDNMNQEDAYEYYTDDGHSAESAKSHIKGINFEDQVRIDNIEAGESLAQFQNQGAIDAGAKGNYFAPMDENLDRQKLGIENANPETQTRQLQGYGVDEDAQGLVSTAADVPDWKENSEEVFTGSSKQIYVPDSELNKVSLEYSAESLYPVPLEDNTNSNDKLGNNSYEENFDNVSQQTENTFNLENQGEQQTMQTFDDKIEKIEQDGLSTPASPTDPNDNDSDNVTEQIEGEADLGDAVREGIIDIDAEREQNQPEVENPLDNLDKLPEDFNIEDVSNYSTPEEVPEYTPTEEVPFDNNPEEIPDYTPQEDIDSPYSESKDLSNTVSDYDWDNQTGDYVDNTVSDYDWDNQTEDYVDNTVSDYDWDNQTEDYVDNTVSDYDDGFETSYDNSYDNSYDTSYEIGVNESCNDYSSFDSDF